MKQDSPPKDLRPRRRGRAAPTITLPNPAPAQSLVKAHRQQWAQAATERFISQSR